MKTKKCSEKIPLFLPEIQKHITHNSVDSTIRTTLQSPFSYIHVPC
jgi:hypothetical protein